MKVLLSKLIVLSFFLPFGLSSLSGQVVVSEVIQESKLVKTESNKLYFVDFWATWCGPCVYAKEMLTVLQKQYPNDFYIISISDESSDKINKYLKKKPSQLAIAVDEEAITFKRYKIYSRPNGILFNSKGEKLWQGHPSDLKPQVLSRYLKTNKSRTTLDEFLQIIKTDVSSSEDYVPTNEIEITTSKSINQELELVRRASHFSLEGKLQDILSYLTKINKKQIDIPTNLNKAYKIYLNRLKLNEENIGLTILDELGLQSSQSLTTGEVIVLNVKESNFWDTNQINWEDNSSKYLISDSDITADDVNLKDLAYQLSVALKTPVVISSSNQKYLQSIHDWEIHYKYFELMRNNLNDYGIEVKKENMDYPKYVISKKAP